MPAQPFAKKSDDRSTGAVGWLAAPVVAIVAVVCCAAPLLVVALAAGGVGTWLAANGFTLGAVTLVALGVVLAWRIGIRSRAGR